MMAILSHRLEKILRNLQSSKPGTRFQACQDLRAAHELPPEAIAALEHRLKDADASVAEAARRALEAHAARSIASLSPEGSVAPGQGSQKEDQAMKCPNCGAVAGRALLRCKACGEVYDRQEFERLGHLDFVLAWLAERSSVIGQRPFEQLQAAARMEREAALTALRPPVAAGEGERPPARVPALDLSSAEIASPEIAVAPATEVAEQRAAVKAQSVVAPPTAPPRAKFDWAKWWERTWSIAVSGALLRGLLYLGALMIVVSAAVLVVRFWDIFPQGLQLVFIAAVPTAFYLAGWLVRTRLKLPQAGSVLAAIGALLLAVDFAAMYQFGGLAGKLDAAQYWLGASAASTAVYAISAWLLPTEAFGYITLLGLASTVVAFSRLLRLPLEWQIAVVAAMAPLMVLAAGRMDRLSDRWAHLSQAGRRLAHVWLVMWFFLVVFVPGRAALGQGATFLMTSLAAGLLSWGSQKPIYAHISVWSSVGALAYLVRATALPVEWYAEAYCAVCVVYTLAHRQLGRTREKVRIQAARFVKPIDVVSWVLLVAAILGGAAALLFDAWAGIGALSLSGLILCWQAWLRKKPLLIVVGASLLVLPFSMAVLRILGSFGVTQPEVWLMAAWAGLALAYLGVGIGLRRSPPYAGGFHLLTQALAPATFLGGIVQWLVSRDGGSLAPTLGSMGGLVLLYTASAVVHDSGRHPGLSASLERLPPLIGRNAFLWPLGFVLPIWLAVAWSASRFPIHWLGAAIGTLALVYVGLGFVFGRRRLEYHWPFDFYGHGLALAGILTAFADRWALLASLYLAVGAFAALAVVRRWAFQGALASLLLLWPFELTLELSRLTEIAYSLAYAVLGSVGFVPLGAVLERAGRRFSTPQYVMGFAVGALAVILSVLGRFGVYAVNVPWVGVATPLLVAALLAYGAWRFGVAFGWAAVGSFAIAYGQALTLLRVPAAFLATAWITLTLAYMLTERSLALGAGDRVAGWWRSFRLPLVVGAAASGALGLALTVPITAAAFAGSHPVSLFPPILAQSLAVFVSVLGARLYRSRWLLYIAAILSFFPYTLAWIAYGPRFTTPQVALPWTGLATVLIAAGFALDRAKERYAHGPYLVGYLLGPLAIGWSAFERQANIYTLSAWVVLAIASQVVVHVGRHRSFDDFIHLIWRGPATIASRAARMLFLWCAAVAFPVWLTQLLAFYEVPLAWRGMALALAAALLIAAGLALRRARAEYTWPLYGVGYALTAIGAMVAFEDEALALYVLGMNALIYAISAYLFRHGAWLYLSNALVPVIALIALHYNGALSARWVAPIFMGLALVYFGVGQEFDRHRVTRTEGVSPYGMPCYAVGYLLSAVALAVATGERGLALTVYGAGVTLYALSGWCFREPLFLYPAVWLAAVPYYLAMTLTELPAGAYGLGWLPLIAVTLALGRIAFHGRRLGIESVQTLLRAMLHPAMPFYLLGYGLSISMVVLSRQDSGYLTLALTTAALLYFSSAGLFRRTVWLFPGLLAAHGALGAFLSIHPSGRPVTYAALPFLVLTWTVALGGEFLAWRFPITPPRVQKDWSLKLAGRRVSLGKWPFVECLARTSWGQPFYIFVVLDVFVWQALAQGDAMVSVVVASGFAVLLGLLATRWRDPVLTHTSLALTVVAVADQLRWADLAFPNGLAWLAGAGFVLYLLGRILELPLYRGWMWASRLAVWPRPLTHFAVLLTSASVMGTLPSVTTHSLAFIASLAFCGALYLAIAYRGRYARLGYLGVAMLELAWILALFNRGIGQPQLYAIPAGLYFAAVGILELRRGRRVFGGLLEAFGLCVLVVTAFVQSLGGAAGFPYFVLLLVEGLTILWWGAGEQRKVPFLIGLVASILNVIAQAIVVINVYQVERWILILGAGLLLVSLAVFVERKREQIIARARAWRDTLEAWG